MKPRSRNIRYAKRKILFKIVIKKMKEMSIKRKLIYVKIKTVENYF